MGGAGGAHALDGPLVDGLDGLGEQLGEHAAGVERQRHDAGERAKAHSDDEQRADHQIGHRAQQVHQHPHRLLDPRRRDVASAGQAERDRQDHRQPGAPQRDLHGEPHLGDIEPPVREVRGQELLAERAHVLGVREQHRQTVDLDRAETDHQQHDHRAPDQQVGRALGQRLRRGGRHGRQRGFLGEHQASGFMARRWAAWARMSSKAFWAAAILVGSPARLASARTSAASISRTGSR